MVRKLPWFDQYLAHLDLELLHHAFLIGGKEGVGKKNFSFLLSQLILCKEKHEYFPCNACQPCKLFNTSNHPDFYTIKMEEGKKKISINQIKELQTNFYESSFLNGNKIFLIENAEFLSKDASDSLLKILEEPPENTYFIITSHRAKQLSATIQSRCSEVFINNPQKQEIENWLRQENTSDENVKLALNLALGRPLKITELLDNNILDSRNNFISEMSQLIKKGKNIISLSEEWPKDKRALVFKLEWMSNLMMDAIRYQMTGDEKEIQIDTSAISMYLGQKVEFNILFELLTETNTLWSLFTEGTNLKEEYQLQSLFVNWENKLGISV
jgi:DNA polymerase III subunit delta'